MHLAIEQDIYGKNKESHYPLYCDTPGQAWDVPLKLNNSLWSLPPPHPVSFQVICASRMTLGSAFFDTTDAGTFDCLFSLQLYYIAPFFREGLTQTLLTVHISFVNDFQMPFIAFKLAPPTVFQIWWKFSCFLCSGRLSVDPGTLPNPTADKNKQLNKQKNNVQHKQLNKPLPFYQFHFPLGLPPKN